MRPYLPLFQSRHALALGVTVGLVTLGGLPTAAHATTPTCVDITSTWPGTGTVEIASANDLYCMGESASLDRDFLMMGNIDLADLTVNPTWRPIASSQFPFIGSLDGGGKTITGLTINQPNDVELGLFGFVRDASISNLTLSAPTVNGGDFVGSLVGEAIDSTITGVTATSVDVTANLLEATVGGLIGSMTHTDVSNVTVDGTVIALGDQTVDDDEGVGGVIGRIWDDAAGQASAQSATVSNASFSGSVSGPSVTGGVIGQADTYPTNGTKWLRLTNLRSSGSVTSTLDFTSDPYPWSIGGAIGLVFDSELGEIHSTSNVTSKVPNTGGVIGSLVDSNLRSASASGAVSLTTVGTECYTGGLIGSTWSWFSGGDPLVIDDVSATGNVSCVGGQDAGGLIGYVGHTNLTNARASGDVTSSGAAAVNTGGLAGTAWDSSLTDVVAEGNVSAAGDLAGGLVGAAFRSNDATSRDVVVTRATTSVEVRGRTHVGGLVGGGENRSTTETNGGIQVISSRSNSNVFGIQSVGGIAGGGSGDFILQDVVSTGAITGWLSSDGSAPSEANYGGLVGYLSDTGSIERAYTTSTLTTEFDLTSATVGSMIGVSNGTLTGLSFTSTNPDSLQVAGTLAAASSENAVYRSLSDLGKFSTYSSWNSPNTVIVDEWVPVSSRTTQVWGTCATVNSGLPFLQWQRTEACPAAPSPPTPSSGGGGTGGGSTTPQPATTTNSGGASASLPVFTGESTGTPTSFQQPTQPQRVTESVTLVSANVAAATPTRTMRNAASPTLSGAPIVVAAVNKPVKLQVPGLTPGATYTIQVRGKNGYVVLGSVTADADGQAQLPVFRMSSGAGTTTLAMLSSSGTPSYVKVQASKGSAADRKKKLRGTAVTTRR